MSLICKNSENTDIFSPLVNQQQGPQELSCMNRKYASDLVIKHDRMIYNMIE